MKKLTSLALGLWSIFLIGCIDEPSVLIVHTGIVQDISEEGARFNGTIVGTTSGNDVLEYGFVWSLKDQPSLEDNYSTAGTGPHSGEFEKIVQSDLLPDTLYYVRAYATQSGVTTYGEDIKFNSKGSSGPSISSFDPGSGSSDKIVTITGRNFSQKPENNIVTIGPVQCTVLSASDTEIKVQLPAALTISGKFKVSVKVGDRTTLSSTDFILEGPVLEQVVPHSAIEGTLVTIKGLGFSLTPSENLVLFGETPASVVSSTASEMKVTVPHTNFAGDVVLSITVNGITGEFESFTIEGPEITSFTPATAYPGTTMTITGKNFSAVPAENKVMFSHWETKVIEATTTVLKVEIPFITSITPGSIFDLTVTVTEKTDTVEQAFSALSPWSEATQFQGESRAYAAGFSIGETGYIGTGAIGFCTCYLRDFWAYNSQNNTWQRKADFAGSHRSYAIGFSINGKGYIGGGYSLVNHGTYTSVEENDELWEYNPANDTWTQRNDLPVSLTAENAKAFTIGGKIYLINGPSFYEYNEVLDQWTSKEFFPGNSNVTSNIIAFGIDGKGYVSRNAKDFYEYNVITDQWTKKADFPAPQGNPGLVSFSIDSKGYAGSTFHYVDYWLSYEFFRYDPIEDKWTQIPSTLRSLQYTVTFTINGNAYYGTGNAFGSYVQNSFVKFNPNF